MNRREFLTMATGTAAFTGFASAGLGVKRFEPDFMWSYLAHFGVNSWRDVPLETQSKDKPEPWLTRCCADHVRFDEPSWRRISDNNLSPRIKCGANYINSRVGQREALRNGYDTCIFLNDAGKVAEGPGSCLFIVVGGKLITPQLTDSVLESITRDTIIKLAKANGIEVVERTIDRTELYTCDEAFLCGSAMEITPVLSVDKYTVGDGQEGTITHNLHKWYLEAVQGKIPELTAWNTPIYG